MLTHLLDAGQRGKVVVDEVQSALSTSAWSIDSTKAIEVKMIALQGTAQHCHGKRGKWLSRGEGGWV